MKFDQEEMRRLAGRYFAGEIAAEEERELFRFVTSDAACRRQFAAWRLEWEAMPASDAATDRDWRRLRSRIRLQGSARSARPGRFAAVWRAAAAVAVVCATFFGARLYDRLLLERATERYTVTTKSGDRSTVCLPDGTQVRLNGSSTLTYPANFNATNRSVELSGAAYFDVSPDEKHRFEVKVGNCSVVVKGTKFDVTAYPDDSLITTTLLEGAVGFTAPPGRVAHLRPFRRDHGHHARQHGAVPGLDRGAHRVHRRDDRAVVREPEQPLRRRNHARRPPARRRDFHHHPPEQPGVARQRPEGPRPDRSGLGPPARPFGASLGQVTPHPETTLKQPIP